MPFIQLLNLRLDLLQLDASTDYRLGRTQGLKVFHAPLGSETSTVMDHMLEDLAGTALIAPDVLCVNGRTVPIPQAAAGTIARFDFSDLCAQALGAGDYLELAKRFPMVMVDNIPTLTPENRDQAKRFVTLIDALYEAKTLVICSGGSPT